MRALGTRGRALLAGAPYLLGVAPAFTALLAWRDRFPEPLASHFGPSGDADGYLSWGGYLAVTAGLGVGLAALFALCAPRLSEPGSAELSTRDTGRWFVGVSWGTATFLGAVLFAAVAANLEVADAAAATLPVWIFPLGLSAGAVAGVVGWLVTPAAPRRAWARDELAPAIRLGPSEQISWSRTVGSRWLLLVGAVLVVGGIVLAATMSWVVGLATAGAGAAVLVLGSARVTVDRRGLTVTFGLLGWPRVRVAAGELAAATVADVSPGQFGGWGYRIVPGAHAVVTRSGPALVVTRHSGSRFVVTVDDPQTAASLLNGLVRSC